MTSDGLPPLQRSVPSGLALAARSVATLLPAPGRFSTTNGVPQISENRSARIRAARSGAVPAVNPTRIFTGRFGYGDCATAADDSVSARQNARQARSSGEAFIGDLLFGGQRCALRAMPTITPARHVRYSRSPGIDLP